SRASSWARVEARSTTVRRHDRECAHGRRSGSSGRVRYNKRSARATVVLASTGSSQSAARRASKTRPCSGPAPAMSPLASPGPGAVTVTFGEPLNIETGLSNSEAVERIERAVRALASEAAEAGTAY